MVTTQVVQRQMVYHQDTTTNQSFMDMHYLLRAKGINNNKFFLAIFDYGLMGVDPRDPTLDKQMKLRILRECTINFWYFIREVVRIPIEGGAVGSGTRYKLHRGNLAMNYLFIHNYNQFVDLPRQHGKTVSGLIWYLWVFNFGSSNTQMMFINKKHEDAKRNLSTMKNLRAVLPEYLQMDASIDRYGKKIRAKNTVETLQHPTNGNIIRVLPAARSKTQADGAGRGCTMAIQYYDEFAFIPYNSVIYQAAIPAYSRASENARNNKVPYGLLITTTPGDLTTDEGAFANLMRLNATPWDDVLYDRTYQELEAIKDANQNSTFFYIRYSYLQLGSGQEYFANMVKELQRDWAKIRREVLCEWAVGSMNCPFKEEDLDTIKSLCKTDPINTLYFGNAGQYSLHIWNQFPIGSQHPPIIGVDVAGGWQNDSSAITIIDSQTTKVLATLNCNYIPGQDLAQIVYEIVTKYMRNAIVNIERNGGYGASVLQLLIKSSIKKNLYYEIKEQVKEERFDGVKTVHRKQKVKSYGTDNTANSRIQMIDLLHQRVNYHKDKFIAPILYDELTTMEVKKNGRTEHAANSHDDQIFSYLMALYVWYYGEDLVGRFNIYKNELKTDADIDETTFDYDDRYGTCEILDAKLLAADEEDEIGNMVQSQLDAIQSATSMTQSEFSIKEQEKDADALVKILQTPYGRKAVSESRHIDIDYLEQQYGNGSSRDISNDILSNFYNEDNKNKNGVYEGNLSDIFSKL